MNKVMENYSPTAGYIPSRIKSSVIAQAHDITIDEPLIHPSDWRDELDLLRNVGPDDVVNLRINSPGGSLSVAVAFLKAMSECCARLVGHNEGECSSAATLLFLGCDEWYLAEGSELMIHTASSGYHGKENNFYEYAIHLNKTVNKLLTKHYKGFLTDEEISQVLKGADMWMDEEDIKSRLENLVQHREEEIDESISVSNREAYEYLKNKTKEEILQESFPDLYEEPLEDSEGRSGELSKVVSTYGTEVWITTSKNIEVCLDIFDSKDCDKAYKLLTTDDIKNACKYLEIDMVGLSRKKDMWNELLKGLVEIVNED